MMLGGRSTLPYPTVSSHPTLTMLPSIAFDMLGDRGCLASLHNGLYGSFLLTARAAVHEKNVHRIHRKCPNLGLLLWQNRNLKSITTRVSGL
jgi:hypothetical protein